MYSELNAWIFLNHVPDLGPMRFRELLQFAGTACGILELSVSDLVAAGASPELAERWCKEFRSAEIARAVEEELRRIAAGEFRAVTEIDAGYPESLKELSDRPSVLYVKGEWPLPKAWAIGVVGTRRASPYGLGVAERITADLVRYGVVTTSGLAAGIDACAHRVTLREKGFTIAALGHGLMSRYPRENGSLFEEIASRGTLVTEFPYRVAPLPQNFPRRNRLISGLARGVVVVEAGEHSGALITARYAAEQGRDVFAVPGPVDSSLSRGCHRLIKEGAKLVETIQDILEEYGVLDSLPSSPKPEIRISDPLQQEILKLLSRQPISVDDMVLHTHQPVDRLASALLSLELLGAVRALPGQRYVNNTN